MQRWALHTLIVAFAGGVGVGGWACSTRHDSVVGFVGSEAETAQPSATPAGQSPSKSGSALNDAKLIKADSSAPAALIHIGASQPLPGDWPGGAALCWHITAGAWQPAGSPPGTVDLFKLTQSLESGGYVPVGAAGDIVIDFEKSGATFEEYDGLIKTVKKARPNCRIWIYHWHTERKQMLPVWLAVIAHPEVDGFWSQSHCDSAGECEGTVEWYTYSKMFTDAAGKPLICAAMTFWSKQLPNGQWQTFERDPAAVHADLMKGYDLGAQRFGLFIPRTCADYPCSAYANLCLSVAYGETFDAKALGFDD